MKLVREHINEKFQEEDVDIIRKMGIGDPELREVYDSLDIVNDIAKGEISDSFDLRNAFSHVKNLTKLIYLTIKFHVDKKFNLNLQLTPERRFEYTQGREFGKADVPPYQFTFKMSDDTNEFYISLSLVKKVRREIIRKHVETSSRCKTLDQLDRQMERFIKKYDIKITP